MTSVIVFVCPGMVCLNIVLEWRWRSSMSPATSFSSCPMFLNMASLSMVFLGWKMWCHVLWGSLSKIHLCILVDSNGLTVDGGSGFGNSNGFATFLILLLSSGSCHSSSVHVSPHLCGCVGLNFLSSSFMHGLFGPGGEALPLFSTSMASVSPGGVDSACDSRVESTGVVESSPAVVGLTVAVLEGSLTRGLERFSV